MTVPQNAEDNNACPACDAPVFQAEAMLAANRKWHKRCYKCLGCKQLLSSATCNVWQSNLFCKHCLAEATRPDSPMLYVDTTKVAPEESNMGCPRCGGAVFKAEEVIEKGRTYHKKCFTCIKCKRPQDDKLQVFVGFDNEIYCKTCYPKIWHTPLPLEPGSTSKIKAEPGDDSACPRCGGKVFEAEKMAAHSGVYHKGCFQCKLCTRPMDASNYVDYQSEVYCRSCYRRHIFDANCQSARIGDTSLIRGQDEDNCPRCGGAVYEAEKIVSRHHLFHRKCLSCVACRRLLDASSFFDSARDGEVYCRGCYSTKYGQRAPRSKSVGPIDSQKIVKPTEDGIGCPKCGGAVFHAEQILTGKGKAYHKECATCHTCSLKLNSMSLNSGPDGNIYCKMCHDQHFGSHFGHSYSIADVKSIKADANDVDRCFKCGGKTYDMERIVTARSKKAYHKTCFSCDDCGKRLDGLNSHTSQVYAHEAPHGTPESTQGLIFCKRCHENRFEARPSDAFYTNGTSETVTDGKDPEACVRCKRKAYDNERILANSGPFHKRCLVCFDCNRNLDSSSFYDGRDGGVYCKGCYSYKYGHRAQSQEHRLVAKALIETDVIKAGQNDPEGCPRCHGKVYEAERMAMRNGVFHKRCFTCFLCKRPMDFSLACDGPKGHEIVCSNCYQKNFGPLNRDLKESSEFQTTLIKPSGEQKGCPRCGGAVFEAEKIAVKNAAFHKKCTTCKLCKKLLDASSLCTGLGQDPEIYCQGCYARLYGGAGYRGTFGGQWIDESASCVLRPSHCADPSIIKATGPEEACRKCGGKVYDLEQLFTKCGMYHKACFNCDGCKKVLNSTLMKYHETKSDGVFCHRCFLEKFGDNPAPNIYAKTSVIVAKDGQGCPRCGGEVFSAEEVIESGRCFHRKCFTCRQCNKPLQDKLQVYIGFDKEVYCRGCCPKATMTNQGLNTSSIQANDDTACPRCHGKVFEAEKMKTRRHDFHRNCFNCSKCKTILDQLSVCEDSQGEIYCKTCYLASYFTGGRNYFLDPTKNVAATGHDDPQGCLKCGHKVFEAEKVPVSRGVFHKLCLCCVECNRMLDQTSYFESSNKRQIYCSGCYSINHGHRARAKSCGPIDYSAVKATDAQSKCLGCEGQVYDTEKLLTSFGPFHKPCFRCGLCDLPLESAPGNARKYKGKIVCRQCKDKEVTLAREMGDDVDGSRNIAQSFVQSASIPAQDGDPDKCPRCSGKVFTAEKMSMKSGSYHRKCFTCCDCKRPLDAGNACDGPNNDIFCHPCYTRYFGPLARWFNEDKGAKTDIIKPMNAAAGCPRCGGAVFEVEKVVANGRAYHKQCTTCRSCNAKLDATTVCCGSDQDIYCQGCSSRKFGGAMYRGSSGGHWIDENANMQMRPCQNVDTSKIKIDNDPDSCKKCQGKVYNLERMTYKSGVWHRQCFNCASCKCTLTSTLDDVFEEDNNLFCRPCLQKFGKSGQGKSMAYADPKSLPAATGNEPACPRCHRAVFDAEKIVFGPNWFHQNCFCCSKCNVKLDNMRAVGVDGKTGEVNCQSCYKTLLEGMNRAATPNTAAIPADKDDPSACPRCQGKVFEAEKMMTRTRLFHKNCFNCCQCGHNLDYTSCMEGPNCEVYCKTCYVKEYFTGGRNKFGDIRSMPEAANNEADACPRCKRKVFDVDKVLSSSGTFHKQCLICTQCSRQLDASNFCDASGRDGHIYCQHCYESKFGVRGLGGSVAKAEDTARLVSDNAEGVENCCPRCGGRVFEAEKMVTSVGPYHPTCFKCATCHRSLDQSSCYAGGEKDIYCQHCYREEFGNFSRRGRSRSHHGSMTAIDQVYTEIVEEDSVAQALVATTSILAEAGDRNKCPRCGGKVFEAEKMISNRGVYHKKCFNCHDCKRALDPALLNDGPQDGLIFCTNCYNKRYGPSVRTFDQEEAKKGQESLRTAKPLDPTKGCVRCGGAVYINEEIVTNGRTYHRQCAKCNHCHRQLDLSSMFDASDKEIYCQGCYGRKFGGAGYRGMQSSSWTDEDANLQFKPVGTVAPNIMKGSVDPETSCVRCLSKVFEAEKVTSGHGVYHRSCYACHDCRATLDVTKACESGEDKAVFCRSCYSKRKGLHGYGYGGFGSIPALTAGGNEIKLEYHFTKFF